MRKKGQSLAEYAIVASLIAVILATMGPAFSRSVQQVLKSVADVLGYQKDAEQAAEPEKGYLNRVVATVNRISNPIVDEGQGVYTKIESEVTNSTSTSLTNLGPTEQ